MVVVGEGERGAPVVYDKSPCVQMTPPAPKKRKAKESKRKKERARKNKKLKKWLSVSLFPNEKFDLFLFALLQMQSLQNLKGFFSDPPLNLMFFLSPF